MSTDPVSVSAIVPAKLNLGLAIVGRRDDGFHELVTIMQTITLCDRLTLIQHADGEAGTRVSLGRVSSGGGGVSIDDPGLNTEDNLAVRAVTSTLRSMGGSGAFEVALEKGIPSASGMGGASADAAAAILATERLMKASTDLVGRGYRPIGQPLPGPPALLGSAAEAASAEPGPGEGSSAIYSAPPERPQVAMRRSGLDDNQRIQIAAGLGSDVPFFLTGGTALVTGRGEHVKLLPPVRATSFIVVFPRLSTPIPRKTARLFAALTPDDFHDGSDVQRQVTRVLDGLPLDRDLLGNGFSRALLAIAPELVQLRKVMAEATGQPVALSGAGPTHYIVEPDSERADWAVERLRTKLRGGALVVRCEPWPGPAEIASGGRERAL